MKLFVIACGASFLVLLILSLIMGAVEDRKREKKKEDTEKN